MKKAMLALVPALLAIGTAAHAADGPVWKVSEVTGDVKVMDGGHSRAAVKGALLASGSVVAAGANARAVLVHDKDFVIVSPNSRIRIALPEQQKGIFQVIAEYGSSLFRIEHKATPHFGVQTPYLAAVVKGTVFSVTVTSTGASVQVTQGAVDVGTLDGGAHELVRPGMIASVGASDRFSLKIDGDNSRTIRSPGAPAASVVTSSAASSGSGGKGGGRDVGNVVSEPVAAPPVSLADTTRGLVQGNNAVALASVNVSKGETARHDNGGGAGNGNGNGGSGNGNNDNSNASGNGSGTSNAGGGGSSNSGSGSSNAGGSGNSNGGSGSANGGSGNDNSNGGSGNGGSGSGSDNSGSGSSNSGSGSSNGGGSDGKGGTPGKDKGLVGGLLDPVTGALTPPPPPKPTKGN